MQAIIKNAFEISLSVSFVIAVLSFLRPLFTKRYHAKWQYWVWLCLALRLCIPVTFLKAEAPFVLNVRDTVVYSPINTSPATSSPLQAIDAPSEAINISPVVSVAPPAGISTPNSIVKRNILLSDVVYFAWVLGAALLATIKTINYLLAKARLMKTATQISSLELTKIAKELCVKRRIKLYYSSFVQSPILIGLCTPCIVLPCMHYEPEHLKMILRHELVHYKRKDISYKLFMMLTCCFYWYNPFVWHMSRLAGVDLEISCDEAVVHGKPDSFKESYGDSILKTIRSSSQRKFLLATEFCNGKKTIKARLDGIFYNKAKRNGRLALCIVLLFCLSCGIMVGCKATLPIVPPQNNNSDFSQAKAEAPVLNNEMLQLINIYENYACGSVMEPLVNVNGYINLRYLLPGYLEENGLMQEYANTHQKEGRGYLDGIDIYKVAQFFGVDVPQYPFFNEGEMENSRNNTFRTRLELREASTLENGDLQFVFARYHDNGREINGAEYTLRKAIAAEIPQAINTLFKQDSEYYKLVRVRVLYTPPVVVAAPVEIKTPEDLVQLASDYNTNGWQYGGVTYKLMNDINMGEITFTPIGLNDNMTGLYLRDPRDNTLAGFNSVFDGGGYTISNLDVRYNADLIEFQRNYCGLFGIVGNKGEVKNLNIKNATINAVGKNYYHCASAGILAGSFNGKAENCHVSGTVNGVTSVGGFAGSIDGAFIDASEYISSIINCSADAAVRGSVYVGGFGGSINQCEITKSYTKGSVTAFESDDFAFSMGTPAGIGGFAGSIYVSKLDDCYADTRLVFLTDGAWYGAFAGAANISTLKNCYYIKATAGNWRPIDNLEEHAWRDDNPDYDVTAR